MRSSSMNDDAIQHAAAAVKNSEGAKQQTGAQLIWELLGNLKLCLWVKYRCGSALVCSGDAWHPYTFYLLHV